MYRVTRTYESGEYIHKDRHSLEDALQILRDWAKRAALTDERITLTIEQH